MRMNEEIVRGMNTMLQLGEKKGREQVRGLEDSCLDLDQAAVADPKFPSSLFRTPCASQKTAVSLSTMFRGRGWECWKLK